MNKTTGMFFVAAAFGAGLIAGCSIKPPTDGQELGPEATFAQVNQALVDAQQGFNVNEDYRVNDRGVVQLTSRVFASQSVRETYEYQVSTVNSTEVIYSILNKGTGEITAYRIDKTQAHAAHKPEKKEEGGLVARVVKKVYTKIAQVFSSIKISPSTALGQDPTGPISVLPNMVSRQILEKHFWTAVNKEEGRPTAKTIKTSASTSKYFGLKVAKHKLLTNNCSQISGCRVNATKVEFDELIKDDAGVEKRVHRLYEISVEVPGLFVFMDECLSTLVNQEENQYPLTECVHVSDFIFGLAN